MIYGRGNFKTKRNFDVSIYASVVGTNQNSLHVSAFCRIAPFAPMNEAGFRFRIGGLAGSYKYLSTAPGVGSVTGNEKSGSLLLSCAAAPRPRATRYWPCPVQPARSSGSPIYAIIHLVFPTSQSSEPCLAAASLRHPAVFAYARKALRWTSWPDIFRGSR